MEEFKKTKPFGLIVGLGTPATIYYYKGLLDACARRGFAADMILANSDFDAVLRFITRNDAKGLAAYFATSIGRLKCAGAEIVALSAVMPHVCMPELAPISALQILDIIEVLARHLTRHKLDRVALLGTQISMESQLFGRLEDVAVCQMSEEELAKAGSIYRSIQIHGKASDDERDWLRRLCDELHRNRGAQAVVLAGTDLADVFNVGAEAFPVINSAQIHIEAIVDWAAG